MFFSQILPFVSPFHSHCHFADSAPRLRCCSSFLTSSLSPLFPSCSSERAENGARRTEDKSWTHRGRRRSGSQPESHPHRGERKPGESHVTSPQEGLGKAQSARPHIQREQKQTGTEKCLWVWRPRREQHGLGGAGFEWESWNVRQITYQPTGRRPDRRATSPKCWTWKKRLNSR